MNTKMNSVVEESCQGFSELRTWSEKGMNSVVFCVSIKTKFDFSILIIDELMKF